MAGKKHFDYERIRELHDRGVAGWAIAARMGCSTRTVRRAIRERQVTCDGHQEAADGERD